MARRFVNVMYPNQDPEEYWDLKNSSLITRQFEWVIVIDCHSKWLEKKAHLQEWHLSECKFNEAHKQVQVLSADPRDPYELSDQYKQALEKLLDKVKAEQEIKAEQIKLRLRVVYDSISDFLVYSDPQLAVQFIKHNMVWEDKMKVSSLYVYIPKIPQPRGDPVDENFLRWNSYCVVEFNHQEPAKDTIILEGLFDKRIYIVVESTEGADYKKI